MLKIGERRVDPRTGEVQGPEAGVSLTSMELALLVYLHERPGQLVSRDELYERVWGYARSVRSRAADVALTRLRRKLEPEPSKPRFFHTIRGEGYRYDPPETGGIQGFWVGRESLLGELSARTDRSLMLVGPGGVGKSSLVRRVVGEAAAWVKLDEGQGLRPALALALGLQSGDDAALALSLEHQPALIVLDGAEAQLADVRALIEAHPDLRIWVTSRHVIEGLERVSVPPLDAESAARLFTHHAERIRQGSLTEQEREDLPELLRALDHNCLAIELAAGRCALLSVAGLSNRLGDLSVLSEGPGGSMEAVLATSWSLLEAQTCDALERLAQFSGEFTVAEAEAVGGPLPILEKLIATSLLRQAGPDHLVLPALVRRRARTRLPGSTSFAEQMASFGDEGMAVQLSPDQAIRSRERLQARLRELVRASEWALDQQRPELSARCVIGLHFASRSVGRAVEVALVERVLQLEPSERLSAWLHYCGAVAHLLERRDPGRTIARGVAASTSCGESAVLALLNGLLALSAVRGTAANEEGLLDEALASAVASGVPWVQASAHSSFGIWHSRNRRWPAADRSYARAQHLFEKVGHPIDVAVVLASRAVLESSRARTGAAIRFALEAARLQREHGNTLGEAYAENTAAVALMMEGDFERSRESFERAGDCFARVGATGPWHFLQAGRGELSFREGAVHEARQIWETAYFAGVDLDWAELAGMSLAGLAMVDALEGGVDEQQERFDEAIALLDTANAHNGRGVAELRRCLAQYRTGSRSEALEALAALIQRLPDVEKGFGSWYVDGMRPVER
ncbi:MAG: winged helix-turn-helix domain-containing protein [Proteobacteria bacterium]|nr:winged helix-turn-helix domain-containing protein [Pseudomonadota bacterium]